MRRLVNYWSLKPGKRAVVLTVDDRGLRAAEDLEEAGVEIAEVVDFRRTTPAIVSAIGHKGHVTGIQLDMRTVKCDLVVMSGSAQPNYKLLAQAGARVEFDAARGDLRADRPAGARATPPASVDRRRRRDRGARAGARQLRRQVLRLLLRGPERQGPALRDRRGLRLDRARQALHDGDHGPVPGSPLPRQLDPRLRPARPASTRTRSGRRPPARRTPPSRSGCSQGIRTSLPSAPRCTTATRTRAAR